MSSVRSGADSAPAELAGAVGEGARTIVWDSLRQGMIDPRPLGPALRLLTLVGLAALLAALGTIVGGSLLVAACGALIAVFAARRSRPSLAAFGAIVAWSQVLAALTKPSRPLAGLAFTYSEVDLLLLLGLAAITIWWAARRKLTQGRSALLLGLAVLGWVLHQTEFLDNPFAPILGGNALALLVVGLLWSVLTAGGRFANADSPGFPRASRILLYLGYIMLALSLATWYILSHSFEDQLTQSLYSGQGFSAFGLALLYLALVETGAPRRHEEAHVV